MTAKEAIDYLLDPIGKREQHDEAIRMAISALEKQDVPDTNVGDMISRRMAMDALSHMMDTDGFRDGWAVSRANVDCMLRALPSAHPERQKGKWVKKSKTTYWQYECSECGSRPPKAEWTSGRYLSRYCPHCGARMENDL